MKKQEILDKIELHTFRIQQIIVRMASYPSSEDMNRLNEESKNLYELTVLLKHIDNISSTVITSEEPQKEAEKKVEKVIETKNEEINPPAPAAEPVIKEVPKPQPSVKTEPVSIPTPSEPIADTTKNKTAEKNTAPKITFNDIQSDEVKEGLIDKFINQKIDDLKKAIALHEKFNFINELFSGKNEEYQYFIDQVNQASTFQEAKKILEVYVQKHNWEEESKVFLKLLQLIQRRHS
jgi:hypothetical protein